MFRCAAACWSGCCGVGALVGEHCWYSFELLHTVIFKHCSVLTLNLVTDHEVTLVYTMFHYILDNKRAKFLLTLIVVFWECTVFFLFYFRSFSCVDADCICEYNVYCFQNKLETIFVGVKHGELPCYCRSCTGGFT